MILALSYLIRPQPGGHRSSSGRPSARLAAARLGSGTRAATLPVMVREGEIRRNEVAVEWPAELESSLVSERDRRDESCRGPWQAPWTACYATTRRQRDQAIAKSTDLSIRQIQKKIAGRASRSIVGEITKRARAARPPAL